MKKISAILHFYRSISAAAAIASIALWCVLHYNKSIATGALYTILILSKISCDAAIWYFARAIMARRLYYYYNLHISRSQLWLSVFIIDLTLFIAGLWIIH